MADNFYKVKKGLNVQPQASPTIDQNGDIAVDTADNKLKVRINGTTDNAVFEAASQTLTNKTLTSPVINTPTGITKTDVGLGNVDNTSDATKDAATATLTNKTLTSPVINTPSTDVVTMDGQASTPSNPSAGNYKLYVDDNTTKLTLLDSSGNATEIGAGGQGGINYIENFDAEVNTDGFATYADAAGTQPVDGTGGSPNVTFTRTTSSPLRGVASFLFTKDAANRQGQGASYDFTIDSADQAKMMQIGFDYSVASGTYATGDLAVYIVDVTNGTVIQPSAYQIENVGVTSVARLTFQTASNSTSYRLCFHVASTSASAYTVKLDNVSLGPQVVPLGAPVTDMDKTYSGTITGTTIAGSVTYTANTLRYGRVGDCVRVSGNIRVNVVTTAPTGSIYIPMPTGLSYDTTKVAQDGGRGVWGTTSSKIAGVKLDVNFITLNTPNTQSVEVQSGTGTFGTLANGDELKVDFCIPVAGWSSSTVVSSSADTRVVNMTARNYSNGTLASGASHTVILNTVASDTHGAYNSATGEYTVKVPGYYSINGEVGMAATAAAATRQLFLYIRVNGTGISNTYTYANTTSSITHRAQARVNWYCNAGDIITLVAENDLGGTGTPQPGTGNSNFSINLIQGPSQIAASEVIAVDAYAPTSTHTSSTTIMTGWTEIVDTHGSFNPTTGIFTAPAPGYYRYESTYTPSNAATPCSVYVYKNGVAFTGTRKGSAYSNGTVNPTAVVFGTMLLNAGDTISFFAQNSSGGAVSTDGANTFMTIHRLGGVG